MVVTPGFVNAHHHLGTTPFQLSSPDHPLELWFASRLALRDVEPRLDTLFSACEMLASGVTTVQHLHSRAAGDTEAVLATARAVLGAYREIGMRASYSMALRDQNRLVYEADEAFVARLPEELRPAMAAYFARFTLPLAEQVRLFHAMRGLVAGEDRLAVQLAPANLHWLSDAALETAAALSAETGLPLHMHLVETPYQRAYARRRTGGTAFAHLHRLGLAGPRLTIGHGVWMTPGDIALCAETGTRLCHNCSSNFRLASGQAAVPRFLAEGVEVALGIDEAGINDDRDMLQEMRMVLTTQRRPGLATPQLSAAQVFRMATEGGAGTTPFGARIGRLSPGCAADLVLFDWERVIAPWQDPATPLLDVLLRRAKPEAIRLVMVAGEVLLRDGRFTRLDRAALHAEIAAHFARPLTPDEQARPAFAAAVLPHVRRFYDGWLEPGELDPPA
jgi:cytosine/adenosine deaminase-related metal-dependent hydrolase